MDLHAVAGSLCHLTGPATRGIEKLAQKFVIELLTEEGSMPYLPKHGCRFLSRLRRSVRTEFDVIVAFAAAYNKVKRSLRSEHTRRVPKDERLAGAYLTSIMVQPGGVLILEIAVRNTLGEVATILTPAIKIG